MKQLLFALSIFSSCGIFAQSNDFLIRVSEIEIDPNDREAYFAILQKEARTSVILEPGVIAIYPMLSKENPTQVRILEIYANREAYLSHLQTPHFLEYKTSTLEMVKSLKLSDVPAGNYLRALINQVKLMLPLPLPPDRDGDGVPDSWDDCLSQAGPASNRGCPVSPTSNFEMILVRGGTFTMGCAGGQGSDCEDDERPAHQVTVSDFYIGKYEVTQKEWREVMGSGSTPFGNCDNCPLEGASWEDIQQFLSRLNAMTGKMYRLPTEAEWEYAARGGASSLGYKYAGSNSLDEVAWYDGNSGSKTHPVGQKMANELGLYDMSGNVWEWCSDWYWPYSSGAQTNPMGPSRGTDRVLRGGSWIFSAEFCRSVTRFLHDPEDRPDDVGFRLAFVP
jgi:quinol monooxygenase YgiN